MFYILQNAKYHNTKTRQKAEDRSRKKKRIDQPAGNQRLIAIRNTTSNE